MKTTHGARRADFVKPHLPEARVQRMWSVVERAQLPARASRAQRLAWVGGVAAAACLALVLWARPWLALHGVAPHVANGDTFATTATQRQVTLPDGSVLSLGPSTRIQVVRVAPDNVRLRLVRGTLTCEVPRVEGRQFSVEAASAEVTVRGTRFTVELEPNASARPELSVSVEHGRVQLRVDGQSVAAVLESGQKWSSQKAPLGPAPAAAAALDEPDAGIPTAAASAPAPARPSARELMERANAARLGGHPAAAAREYAHLRDWYTRDPRAGLAAFELGRIRLNSLGDARGALDAFRFALAHPGGFFAEDAQAGIVEALNRLGDTRACSQARDAFVERYANSAHAARVRLLCVGR